MNNLVELVIDWLKYPYSDIELSYHDRHRRYELNNALGRYLAPKGGIVRLVPFRFDVLVNLNAGGTYECRKLNNHNEYRRND